MSRVLGNDVRSLLTKGVRSSPLPGPLGSRSSSLWLSAENVDVQPCLRPFTLATRQIKPRAARTTGSHVDTRHISTTATDNAPSQNVPDNVEDEKAPQPPLAIVFTDIVKSTALWEKDLESMNEAMAIHDDLIRGLADKYAGYEVKQNGDGFMFAFQAAPSALSFCLDIQVKLQAQKWPEALLKLAPAEPVIADSDETPSGEVVLWKGLRLRMSAHYGEPVCKWNDVIGRMDYLGPAVNRAARFVGVCEGGQIVVSQEFLRELRRARREVVGTDGPLFDQAQASALSAEDLDVKELSDDGLSEDMADTRFELRVLGERHFKGVPGSQKLYFIIPKSLRGRIDYLPKQEFVQASKGNLMEGG